jgi:transposase
VVDEKEAEAAARIAAERAYTQRLMSVPVDVLKSGDKWSMDQWRRRV